MEFLKTALEKITNKVILLQHIVSQLNKQHMLSEKHKIEEIMAQQGKIKVKNINVSS